MKFIHGHLIVSLASITGCTTAAKEIPADKKTDLSNKKLIVKKEGGLDGLGTLDTFRRHLTPGDDCATATAINISPGSTVMVSGTTIGTNPESGISFCETVYSNSPAVWYKVIGTGGLLSFDTCSSNTDYDTKLHIFSGSCGSPVCVTGNDDDSTCSNFRSRTDSFLSILGTEYFILVHGFGSLRGNFELAVTEEPLPPCDITLVDAFAPDSPATVSGTTMGAGSQFGVPFCDTSYSGAPARLYKVIGTGGPLEVDSCSAGTDYDTKIHVMTGSCGAWNCVTGNDDSSCGFSGLHSRVSWDSIEGMEYIIIINGFIDDRGNFDLTVTDLRVNSCGLSTGLINACSNESTLQCCDPSTSAVGPACCGTMPYDPLVKACCGDGSLVEGTSDTACAPSGAPSSTPSQIPSSFPSAEPTPLTCDLGPVCDYEFVEAENGGIILNEVYYAVCTNHDGHYHQECYPDSLVGSLGSNDVIPEAGRDGDAGRVIVSCGCCPDTMGTQVKGSTAVCEGGLDCFAEGADFSV